jgi:hypothetical protein
VGDITPISHGAVVNRNAQPETMRPARVLLDGAHATLASKNNEKPSSPTFRLVVTRRPSVGGRRACLAAQRLPAANTD